MVLGDPWERVTTLRLRNTALGTIHLLSSAGNLWSRVIKLRAAWVLCLLFLGLRRNPLTFQLLPHSSWDDFSFRKMMQRRSLCLKSTSSAPQCFVLTSKVFLLNKFWRKNIVWLLSVQSSQDLFPNSPTDMSPHLIFPFCLVPRAGGLSSYQVLVLDKSCLPWVASLWQWSTWNLKMEPSPVLVCSRE